MFDILLYLYEKYLGGAVSTDPDTLQRELSGIGFEEDEIASALTWLQDLERLIAPAESFHEPSPISFRCYAPEEKTRIGVEGLGFLMFLQSSSILSPVQLEWVLDRVMAIDCETLSIDQLKWIVIMVRAAHAENKEFLVLQELLFRENETTLSH